MINKSYSYLIPLIDIYCHIDPMYFILIDQCYAIVSDEESNRPLMALTYSKENNEMFNKYLNEIRENQIVHNVIETDENITFIFEFPETFVHEYNCFIRGKFSEFSKEAKSIVIDYVSAYHHSKTAMKVRMVLNKEIELKRYLEKKLDVTLDADLDLSSKPGEEELFKVIS